MARRRPAGVCPGHAPPTLSAGSPWPLTQEQDDAEGRTSCWAFGMTELTPAARRTLCPRQARVGFQKSA